MLIDRNLIWMDYNDLFRSAQLTFLKIVLEFFPSYYTYIALASQ
jgi:hypothetical protein